MPSQKHRSHPRRSHPTEEERVEEFRRDLLCALGSGESETSQAEAKALLDVLIRYYCFLRGERLEIWRRQQKLLENIETGVSGLSEDVAALAAVRPQTPGFDTVAWDPGVADLQPALDEIRSWIQAQLRRREALLARAVEMIEAREALVREEIAAGAPRKRAVATVEARTSTALDMAALDLPDPKTNAWKAAFILRCAERHLGPTEMAKIEFLATRTPLGRDLGLSTYAFSGRQVEWAKAMKRYGLPAEDFKAAVS